MSFTEKEKDTLLRVKGIGPKVIERLEQIGLTSFEELAGADSLEVTRSISEELGSTCWQNSPQARSAIDSAIATARAHTR